MSTSGIRVHWIHIRLSTVPKYYHHKNYITLPKTKVVKIMRKKNKVVQDCDVYIGRECRKGGWNLDASKWANPFVGKEAVDKYRKYILSKPTLLEDIEELRGKRLGCWCKPKPCHGDVLIELLNK
jgi:hypothetical protein